MRKSIIEWIIAIGIGIAIAWIVTTFIVSKYHVHGDSMYPTFKNNDRLVVNQFSITMDSFSRGDVIVFQATKDKDYIKRLIGVPGDKVHYKNDRLYINNHYVKEPYLNYNRQHKIGDQLTEDFDAADIEHANQQQTIPKGKYLVLGDNRTISKDRRSPLGIIDKADIKGKVAMRYAPLERLDFGFYADSFDKINKIAAVK